MRLRILQCDIHSDHSCLDTLGIPLNSTLKWNSSYLAATWWTYKPMDLGPRSNLEFLPRLTYIHSYIELWLWEVSVIYSLMVCSHIIKVHYHTGDMAKVPSLCSLVFIYILQGIFIV